ncbi:MAG: Stk1 family PASTA domain-containing Ser/Thr kinase [Clostridia bacterium]|jgi:serine/threonine-protein kinase
MHGRILGGRYELIEKIGGGGMAQVYKAKDQLLNRFVAVKILRQEFIDDDEFVKRFKVEAQSSAGLSHPNIVSIYDVGQDDTIQYIVMELIDGITLKEYIVQNGHLPWDESINIAIQICSAIEHAHKNHIIHRDIKPQNILMTDTGVAKVTDFGIARAVSASTITLAGNTIGSVHYFSPEQARGGFVDEKSDLYSIGITLYEMVTGKIPFDGDTPVAVALKHIQDTPVSPMTLNESIPAGVNDIIMKAIKKDQNVRYQKASELLEDLNLVLNQPGGGFVEDEEDVGFSTKRIKTVDEIGLINKNFVTDKDKQKSDLKKKEKFKYWIVGVAAVILVALITYISYLIVVKVVFPPSGEYTVTNYVGKNINDVKQELDKAFIKYNIKPEFSSLVEKDIIISQNKLPGDILKQKGFEEIGLVVSSGANLITMADYAAKDPRVVRKELEDLGISSANIIEKQVFSDDVETGLVVDTAPKFNEQFKLTDTITINVSKGPKVNLATVPDLFGKTLAQAKSILKTAKLVVGDTFPNNGDTYFDKIVKQSPSAGASVKEGDPVNIYFKTNQKVVTWIVSLTNPGSYTDPLNVMLVITPSDTNVSKTTFNEQRNKNDFPLYFSIPVPSNGSTKAEVYINSVLYTSKIVK